MIKLNLEDFYLVRENQSENSAINIPDNLDFNVAVEVKHLFFCKIYFADNLLRKICY